MIDSPASNILNGDSVENIDPAGLLDEVMSSLVDWKSLSNDELMSTEACPERTREWLCRNEAAIAAWVDRNHSDFMLKVERITRAHVDNLTLAQLGEELGDLASEVARRALSCTITDALLHKIARQVVAEKTRRRRVSVQSLEALQTYRDGEVGDIVADPEDLHAQSLDQKRESQVKQALDQVLTRNLAQVIWLKVYRGFTTEEVADELAIEVEAAKKRFQRAAGILRAKAQAGQFPAHLADPEVAQRYATSAI